MKLMSLKQYMKMSKPALIRKIMKTLRAMPKKRLAVLCYNITKAKLPQLRVTKRKALTSRKRNGKYYLTKTGQPFIILPSGKALFISKIETKGMRNAGKWDPVEVRTKRRKR
jgi:hypothetical protein